MVTKPTARQDLHAMGAVIGALLASGEVVVPYRIILDDCCLTLTKLKPPLMKMLWALVKMLYAWTITFVQYFSIQQLISALKFGCQFECQWLCFRNPHHMRFCFISYSRSYSYKRAKVITNTWSNDTMRMVVFSFSGRALISACIEGALEEHRKHTSRFTVVMFNRSRGFRHIIVCRLRNIYYQFSISWVS